MPAAKIAGISRCQPPNIAGRSRGASRQNSWTRRDAMGVRLMLTSHDMLMTVLLLACYKQSPRTRLGRSGAQEKLTLPKWALFEERCRHAGIEQPGNVERLLYSQKSLFIKGLAVVEPRPEFVFRARYPNTTAIVRFGHRILLPKPSSWFNAFNVRMSDHKAKARTYKP